MALPDLIPVEDFFAPPARAAVSLSPDGTQIAYLAPWEGRQNVWVESVDTPEDVRCVTRDPQGVHRYHWTSDPRWLLYTRDRDGDEHWHLYRVDQHAPHAGAVDLTPGPRTRVMGVDLPHGRPGKAIVQVNLRDPDVYDLMELDVATGELVTVVTGSGGPGWLYGPDGEVFRIATTAGGDLELSRRDTAAGGERSVAVFDGADYPLGVYPMDMTPDGTGVWVGSNRDTDRTRLVRIDLRTGEETEVDSHPVHDLDTRALVFPRLPSPLIRRRRTGELIGARYLGERQVIHALDPHFAEVLANLEKLHDGDIGALDSDLGERYWVVTFTHDREPVTYLYDHDTGESRPLFRGRPSLDPAELAEMRPVTVTARDGLPLPSYLTLPNGVAPERLPLLLFVHGGPWSRDSWSFNPVAQLFANRGYAVLQVNFRGSAGYGKAFTKAAIGQFAGKMHDDLVDGVRWAVGQGYADPDRVAILGGSYGGYAALVGVTFTPDVFAAAVDIVGVSSLAAFMESQPEFLKPDLAYNWHLYVGDPADPEQRADMLARSPISRVDRVRTPLMVVQGAQDARVPQAESDRFVEALRERGTPVEYLLVEDEGHAFDNPANATDLYRAAERFLAEHLGVPARG
ncbi:alpha/beta fold hydrolase [Streptomyces olivaceus]|uniref:S9 family peptidase n=1 Tax=Streptomyces TaxID=1883 RepID=UPI0008780DD1|nr:MULTISPECIES: S9 family peptidase [Streptomyces]AOW87846.1 peptidase [Streptomyces olivaceus]MBZ6307355.1 S9 family peptidase [Streptomyces olivaceus]MBZ6321250.1 S9 family peptidase [Streptomyces olivaceus]QIP71355.1 S9 family peptidase [Streptomyces sp. VN1]GHJ02052.1 putative peptidase [Streptomyces olivaceus]